MRAIAEPGALVRVEAADVAPVDSHPAGRGRQQPGDGVEQRGLAGAVRTDQARDLARSGTSTLTSESARFPPNFDGDVLGREQRRPSCGTVG